MALRPPLGALPALALCLTILVACSSDEDPGADPTPIFSEATSTPSPTPSDPTAPEDETAEEFIYRWVEANNQMLTTGDSTLFRELSAMCRVCLRNADRIERERAAGGSIETKGLRILKVVNIAKVSDRQTVAYVNVRVHPESYKESADGPVEHYEGGDFRFYMKLRPGPQGWRLLSYSQGEL